MTCAVALLVGCGGDDPVAPRSVDGTYSLSKWNGQTLPALSGEDVLGSKYYVVGGRLVLDGFGYEVYFTEREMRNGATVGERELMDADGSFTVTGEQAASGTRLAFDLGQFSFSGFLSEDRNTIQIPSYFGRSLVFGR